MDSFYHDDHDRQAFRLMTWVFAAIFAATFTYMGWAISTRHGADAPPARYAQTV